MDSPVVGQQLRSQVCTTRIVVLELGTADATPHCGDVPMCPAPAPPCSEAVEADGRTGATVAGTIYRDGVTGLTVRCTRSGAGTLSVAGHPMTVVEPGHLCCR